MVTRGALCMSNRQAVIDTLMDADAVSAQSENADMSPIRHAVSNVPTTPAAKAAAARLKGSQRNLRMRRRARGPRLGSWGDTPARAALSFTVYLNPTHPHGYIEPTAIMRRWVCVGLDQERGKLRIRAA